MFGITSCMLHLYLSPLTTFKETQKDMAVAFQILHSILHLRRPFRYVLRHYEQFVCDSKCKLYHGNEKKKYYKYYDEKVTTLPFREVEHGDAANRKGEVIARGGTTIGDPTLCSG